MDIFREKKKKTTFPFSVAKQQKLVFSSDVCMAPLNKSKKKSKKLKIRNSGNLVPLEPKGYCETEWWPSFWQKNSSSIPGQKLPYDEEEGFKYFFRVSRNTFDYICSLVRADLISRPPSGLINIEGRLLSVEKQVAIALRRLASGESQVSVGSAFGVGQSTVSQVTWRFIEALEERGTHHLKWPDSIRMEEIKSKFKASFGLPNCCGAIDATHIVMTLPAVETSGDWCDTENNFSMFLQGVFDDEMRFLDIVTGWPGGMTTSKLLKFSGLFKKCEAGERLNGNNMKTAVSEGVDIREYIVGGVHYPLLPWLITPYIGDNNISASMSAFNVIHDAARALAARAFSRLKGSWRILNKVMWRPDKRKLPSIILVCCLLHNIVIDSGDKLHVDVLLSNHHDSGYGEKCCKQTDSPGSTMRENLMKHMLHSNEKSP